MGKCRTAGVIATLAFACSATGAQAQTLQPLDKQQVQDQYDMSWGDYKPIPNTNYQDPAVQPTVKKWKVALVLGDFPNRPFHVTQAPGSTVFGNPQATAANVPRADVGRFYADFLNTPQALNNFQTMNRYWMEDSFGKYGVDVTPFGPYAMDFKDYQYWAPTQNCPTPTVTPCGKNFSSELRAKWTAAVGAATVASFDNIFWVSAGQDQSSTWQEFGNGKFLNENSIPDAFGPKALDPSLPNWASSRYVPWTSWVARTNVWPSASGNSSTEAESSGMATYAHELSHNLSIPDNYNNPFGEVQQRAATGIWDMLSRGSFNGPGGTHTRWQIPPTQGGSLGAQHNVRNKRKLNFLDDGELLRLNRNGLAQSGLAVGEVTAREVKPGPNAGGVQVTLDGGDKTPPCDWNTNPLCDGVRPGPNGTTTNAWNHYTIEAVQRIGADSFTPAQGVLISKTKDNNSSCGTYSCFVWIIDAHPEDINRLDFVKPDGTPQMVTIADPRQLNDATFNAGTNSGSSYEYVDQANRLHFYILDVRKDAAGVVHYKVAVKSLDGAGPQSRGVSLSTPVPGTADGFATCTFGLKNTGAAATTPNVHPQDASAFLGADVYRLSATASGAGWSAQLKNALATAKFGETIQVPVYVTKGAGSGSVTLQATSESDPSKGVSASCSEASVGGSVPATLSLATGTPANFGPFTPGVARDYTATMAATVTSTAGDAALSVADPSTANTGKLVNGAFTLAQPVGAKASSGAGAGGDYKAVGGSAAPASVLAYSGPVSNDAVTVGFRQVIGANEALRTGTYSKTLTFTLSTTTP